MGRKMEAEDSIVDKLTFQQNVPTRSNLKTPVKMLLRNNHSARGCGGSGLPFGLFTVGQTDAVDHDHSA